MKESNMSNDRMQGNNQQGQQNVQGGQKRDPRRAVDPDASQTGGNAGSKQSQARPMGAQNQQRSSHIQNEQERQSTQSSGVRDEDDEDMDSDMEGSDLNDIDRRTSLNTSGEQEGAKRDEDEDEDVIGERGRKSA